MFPVFGRYARGVWYQNLIQLLVLAQCSPLLGLHMCALHSIQAAHIRLGHPGRIGWLRGAAVVHLGRQPGNLQLP